VRRELFRCGPVFRNETAAYSTVIPTFQRFFGDIVAFPFPRCLHADLHVRSDLIVLEDLRPAGFVMTNRMEGLDLDHCRLVLQVRECVRLTTFPPSVNRLYIQRGILNLSHTASVL
jgi:hypothetical protein